jgi:hypothetical protein
VNWVLDADIRGFFDQMSHEWTMKFVQHRVADPRILRLIQKWLKAGVSEDGQWSETKVGTPQGSVASPLLANICLHYVFDLWVEAWREKVALGDVIVVRYADDLVVGFESRAEAERFLGEFRERLAKFGLELHAEKTRLIEVWAVRRLKPKAARRGKARDLHVSGLHALLWDAPQGWSVHRMARDGEETAGGQAPSDQNGAETPPARAHRVRGCVAPEGGLGLLPIPRCSRQLASA